MKPVASAPHLRLVDWWKTTSSGIATAESDPARIVSLEQHYGITLPATFRSYLLLSAPQNDPSWDNELTNWWPVDRLKSIADEYEHDIAAEEIRGRANECLFFADCSIWCWAWAICCDNSEHRGKVAVIGGKDRFVAASFDDFVTRYIADPFSCDLLP